MELLTIDRGLLGIIGLIGSLLGLALFSTKRPLTKQVVFIGIVGSFMVTSIFTDSLVSMQSWVDLREGVAFILGSISIFIWLGIGQIGFMFVDDPVATITKFRNIKITWKK